MAISRSHFDEVTNGYERTTSGLWTHKGKAILGDVTLGNTTVSGNLGVSGSATVSGALSAWAITGNGQLLVGSPQPRIHTSGWSDAHIRIDQAAPAEPRIGFHESGNSALALYKPSGSQSRLRVRGNDGVDYEVAGATGSVQSRVAAFSAGSGWASSALNTWQETDVRATGTFTGVDTRIEWSLCFYNDNGGATNFIGLGWNGGLTWQLAYVTTPVSGGYWSSASGTMYHVPSAGTHRLSLWVMTNSGVTRLNGATHHTIWCTEQRI